MSNVMQGGMGPSVTSLNERFPAEDRANARVLSRWLFLVAAIVGLIVAVGGITRLTESGLSITEWKPVSGVLPPLTQGQWEAQFELYKQIPQYIEVTGPAGMTLEDYKFIFFWEWFHRVLARGVGLVFALPLAFFWFKKRIPEGYQAPLVCLLALGGFQGFIGWWMVTSGLSADVKVSHFRLATHLLVALITMSGLLWTGFALRARSKGFAAAKLTGFSAVVLVVMFLQLFYGALMAGLRAGYVAPDWPLMQGSFLPAGIDWAQGMVHTFLYDPFLIHFIHRWWAWALVAVLIVLARRVRAAGVRKASIAIHSSFGIQILLGIATVMTGVELWVAVAHQVVGAVVVAATIAGIYILGAPNTPVLLEENQRG